MGDAQATTARRLKTLARDFGWSRGALATTMDRLGEVRGLDAKAGYTLPDRYEDLGLLGRGGQGVVRLVCDHHLGRLAALKLLTRMDSAEARALFLAETRTTARLEHPGIVPIYDRGSTAEGCPWYAMRYVEGRSLERGLGPDGLALRRRVEILLRVSEAMAYAHHNGVVHLDLKPANVLLGPFGEVLVTDWGLAQPVGELAEDAAVRGAGTLAYMPPEQKVGTRTIRPTADVCALGATLLHMLTNTIPSPGENPATEGPLWDIVRRARAWYPADRPPDAAAFGEALRAWLDGQARRDVAAALVARAQAVLPEIDRRSAEAAAAEAQAAALLSEVPSHAPVAAHRAGWRATDQAAEKRREVRQLHLKRLGQLRRALEEAPEAGHARGLLVTHHRAALLAAEADGDEVAADTHVAALQGLDPKGQASFLRGDGQLRLVTEPVANATLYRVVDRDRRWVTMPARALGRTPLTLTLPRGRYVVVLTAPGRVTTRYPVHITRGLDSDGRAPGDSEPTPIRLAEALGEDEIHVPAGWFTAGGDLKAMDGLPRQRIWVDDFIIARHPVTHREYLGWLNALRAGGRPDLVAENLPRVTGESLYEPGPQGQLVLGEAYGVAGTLDDPVTRVTPEAALAYAAWRGARDGVPWRLPHALEWEKAARGVDGRAFPIGDRLAPVHANVIGSLPGRPLFGPVQDFPLDRSPYGVAGMTGNVRDICGSRYVRGGLDLDGARLEWADHAGSEGFFEVRGGSFSSPPDYCRAASRFAVAPGEVAATAGFRLVRSGPP